jgi:small subunit ribosomal protein S16
MSVKIRLARHGRRKAPYYRMVVADNRYPRDGRFIDILGIYHPLNKKAEDQIRVDEAKTLKWLNDGAIPSDTCRSILSKQGIMQKFHEAKVAARQAAKAAKPE